MSLITTTASASSGGIVSKPLVLLNTAIALGSMHPVPLNEVQCISGIMNSLLGHTFSVTHSQGGNVARKYVISARSIVYHYAQGQPGAPANAPDGTLLQLPEGVDGNQADFRIIMPQNVDYLPRLRHFEATAAEEILKCVDPASTMFTQMSTAMGRTVFNLGAGTPAGILCTMLKLLVDAVGILTPKVSQDLIDVIEGTKFVSAVNISSKLNGLEQAIMLAAEAGVWIGHDPNPGSSWAIRQYKALLKNFTPSSSEPEMSRLAQDLKQLPQNTWCAALFLETAKTFVKSQQSFDDTFGNAPAASAMSAGVDGGRDRQDQRPHRTLQRSGRGRNNGGGRGRDNTRKCFGCGGSGHVRRDCETHPSGCDDDGNEIESSAEGVKAYETWRATTKDRTEKARKPKKKPCTNCKSTSHSKAECWKKSDTDGGGESKGPDNNVSFVVSDFQGLSEEERLEKIVHAIGLFQDGGGQKSVVYMANDAEEEPGLCYHGWHTGDDSLDRPPPEDSAFGGVTDTMGRLSRVRAAINESKGQRAALRVSVARDLAMSDKTRGIEVFPTRGEIAHQQTIDKNKAIMERVIALRKSRGKSTKEVDLLRRLKLKFMGNGALKGHAARHWGESRPNPINKEILNRIQGLKDRSAVRSAREGLEKRSGSIPNGDSGGPAGRSVGDDVSATAAGQEPTFYRAISDSASTQMLSGNRAMFREGLKFDENFGTTTTASGTLSHRHGEWLMTTIWNVAGKDVGAVLPIYWRYEKDMPKGLTLFATKWMVDVTPESRATLGGGENKGGLLLRNGNADVNVALNYHNPDFFKRLDGSAFSRNVDVFAISTSSMVGMKPPESLYESVFTFQHLTVTGDTACSGTSQDRPKSIELTDESATTGGEDYPPLFQNSDCRAATFAAWHYALNHRSDDIVLNTIKHGSGGTIVGRNTRPFCATCVRGKGQRQNKRRGGGETITDIEKVLGSESTKGLSTRQIDQFKLDMLDALRQIKPEGSHQGETVVNNRAVGENLSYPGAAVSGDLLGPFIFNGTTKVYVMLFVDYATTFLWCVWVKQKSDAYLALMKVAAELESNKTPMKIMITDDGGEHRSQPWKDTCASLGVKHRPLVARSQWGNYVERAVQTVLNAWRCALLHAYLPPNSFGMGVLNGVISIENMIGKKSLGWKSAYYAFHGVDPDLSRLHTIGANVYAIKPHSTLTNGKLGEKAVEGIWMGPDMSTTRGCLVKRMDSLEVIRTRDVAGEELMHPRRCPPAGLVEYGHVQLPRQSSNAVKSLAREARGNPDLSQDEQLESMFSICQRASPAVDQDADVDLGSANAGGPADILIQAQVPVADASGFGDNLFGGEEGGHPPKLGSMGSNAPGEGGGRRPERHNTQSGGFWPEGYSAVDLAPPTEANSGQRLRAAPLPTDAGDPAKIIFIEVEKYAVEPCNAPFLGQEEGDGVNGFADVTVDGEIETLTSMVLAYDYHAAGETFGPRAGDDLFTADDTNDGNPDSRSGDFAAWASDVTDTRSMTYREAITDNPNKGESEAFQLALKKEWLKGIVGKGHVVYKMEDEVPAGIVPIPFMSLFTRKLYLSGPNAGQVQKVKCRIVLRGDLQDVSDITLAMRAAPTCDMSTGRAMIAVTRDTGIFSMKVDSTQAFLCATPRRELWAFTSEGCHRWDNATGQRKIVLLLGNLYGGAEAAMRWARLAIQEIMRMKFKRSLVDTCLFRREGPLEVLMAEIEAFNKDPDMDRAFKGVDVSPPDTGACSAVNSVVGDADPDQYTWGVDGDVDVDWQEGRLDTHHYSGPGDRQEDLFPFDRSSLIASQLDIDTPGRGWALVCLYVDDSLVVSNVPGFTEYFAKRFLKLYPGTSEANPTSYLGTEIVRSPIQGLWLEIRNDLLITKLLRYLRMTLCKPARIPMREEPMIPTDEEVEANKPYMRTTFELDRPNGMIGYMRGAHPWSVMHHSMLSRLNTRPTKRAVMAVKYFCRYLSTRIGTGVRFLRNNPQRLIIFVDTNFDTTVYTSITVYWRGGVIYAKSLRQKWGSLSTFDAELSGMSEAAKVAFKFRELTRDFGFRDERPTLVLGDNLAAVNELRKGLHSSSTKPRHHRVRAQWAKQLQYLGGVEYQHVSSANNVADIGTKVMLDVAKWEDLTSQVQGLKRLSDEVQNLAKAQTAVTKDAVAKSQRESASGTGGTKRGAPGGN